MPEDVQKVGEETLRARRDAEVARCLNELFVDSELAEEQARTARELDAAGTDWSDERW